MDKNNKIKFVGQPVYKQIIDMANVINLQELYRSTLATTNTKILKQILT